MMVRQAAWIFSLALWGCGDGAETTSSEDGPGSEMGSGGGPSDPTDPTEEPVATGGATSTGGASSTGGATGSGGSGEMMGTGGESMATTGTPFVFVGSTEGDLRAYTMSESDGSLSAAGSIQLSALGFFTVGPQQDPGSEVRTIFVSSGNSVAAVDYDPTTQMFTLGPTATTSGGGTHVTTDPSGSSVMVAHYGQDALSFFGYDGAGFSAEQPFAPGDNAHQARFREGKVYVPCLGSNHIAQFDWTAAPQLAVATPASAAAAGGPRHMDFHPTQPVAYVLAELSSEIHVYDIAADGSLSLRGDASLFTHEDGEYHWSSDIKVTPDGRFVYAVNRDPSEVVLFTVGDDFNLTRGASTPLVGEVRSFGMDPKGSFLQIGSKDGILQTLSINPSTGALTAGPSQSGLGTIHNTEVHYFELP